MNFRSLALLAALAFTSCGDFMEVRTIKPKVKKNKRTAQAGGGGIGQLPTGYDNPLFKKAEGDGIQIGKAAEAGGYLPTEVGEDVKIQGYTLPSDDQIAWSDETNPNADIAFEKAFLKPVKNKGGWGVSFQDARRESMASGKPLVMWFTNKKAGASPVCKKLSSELFSKTKFKNWARDEIVRVSLDLNGGAEGVGDLNHEVTVKRNYIKKLQKRYRVKGTPVVVILSPSGEVIDQYRGFSRGQGKPYFQQMKDRVLTEKLNTKNWRKRMKRRGYRLWTGKNGQKIYGRLLRYAQGELILVEPNGRQSKTSVRQLSQTDREWISAEKEKRRQRRA